LYYHVNRKLSELAGNSPELAKDLLGDLCAEDFVNSDYKVLMTLFEEALKQDQLEPLEYLQVNLSVDLLEGFDWFLIDQFANFQQRIRRFETDWPKIISIEIKKKGFIDNFQELVKSTLELRRQRLKRQTQEISFLQMDAQASGDDNSNVWLEHHSLIVSAIGKIDIALGPPKNLNR
jgi:hypothetical protein